ncbi:hypothetical protein CHLRE_12g547850v5 [Chlamydomonas reinhardtii]|uniref:Uncharacterized protein n=1 Tax=Chlamydomonas reinhardtii TaxID=3055 RepID=A8IYD5_CHLRE|nr:uncharacterized protein CHLRE_12g547850v5 [Chlamydomonas reinhardtii]PNW76099.1 hypothetical protein CHLRE_12g547850v5 [Chlamydomonas reinhardtii]|eukprot:XP_001693981.1 predicted protein [Chlamydomonas reinhardtii]
MQLQDVPTRRGPAPARSAEIDSYLLKPLTGDVEFESAWISTALATWLDEEWTVLPEHQVLAKAAADAYVGLRRKGENDMGNLVLAVASELLSPELAPAFRASFTSPFEVSNKLSETVMLKDGCDVCCTSAADRERIERVNQLMSGSSM